MLNLKHERVWCAWHGPKAQFVSAKDGAPLTARHAGPAWPATAPDVVDPANLAQVAQASIAAMERAKAAETRVADPGTALVTFAEAMAAVHRLVGDSYPPHFALALSLDAAGVIAVSLLDAWDDARDSIKEGADLWTATLDSYTEKCWTGADGTTALRIIVRGSCRQPCRPPAGWRSRRRGS